MAVAAPARPQTLPVVPLAGGRLAGAAAPGSGLRGWGTRALGHGWAARGVGHGLTLAARPRADGDVEWALLGLPDAALDEREVEWATGLVPGLVGGEDDIAGREAAFARHPLTRSLTPYLREVRLRRSPGVFAAMAEVIPGQLIAVRDARAIHRRLCRIAGLEAPLALVAPPDAREILTRPSWMLHRTGLAARRVSLLRACARSHRALEALRERPRPDRFDALLSLCGCGPWTAALVARQAWGDEDTVDVYDAHTKDIVCAAFDGTAFGTDERMLELLEPFRPFRAQVIALLMAASGRRLVRRPGGRLMDPPRR